MVLPILPALWRPLLAGSGMAAVMLLTLQVPWIMRAVIGAGVYFIILAIAGEPELKLAFVRQDEQRGVRSPV
jgi:hypothetical protein